MISPKNIITSKTPLLTPHDSSTQPVSCVDTRPGLISCKIVTSHSDPFYPPPVLLGNRQSVAGALREGNPAQTRLPGVSARLSDDRELRHAPAARQVATKVAAADSSVNTGPRWDGRRAGNGGACLRRWGIEQLWSARPNGAGAGRPRRPCGRRPHARARQAAALACPHGAVKAATLAGRATRGTLAGRATRGRTRPLSRLSPRLASWHAGSPLPRPHASHHLSFAR